MFRCCLMPFWGLPETWTPKPGTEVSQSHPLHAHAMGAPPAPAQTSSGREQVGMENSQQLYYFIFRAPEDYKCLKPAGLLSLPSLWCLRFPGSLADGGGQCVRTELSLKLWLPASAYGTAGGVLSGLNFRDIRLLLRGINAATGVAFFWGGRGWSCIGQPQEVPCLHYALAGHMHCAVCRDWERLLSAAPRSGWKGNCCSWVEETGENNLKYPCATYALFWGAGNNPAFPNEILNFKGDANKYKWKMSLIIKKAFAKIKMECITVQTGDRNVSRAMKGEADYLGDQIHLLFPFH